LLALMGGAVVASRAMISSFTQVEATAARQRSTQMLRAIDTDFSQLALSNRDYAEWDDAEEFVRSANPRFLTANFNKDSLDGMHVDLVVIVDRDGRTLFSAFYDRDAHALLAPAPPEMSSDLLPYARHPEILAAVSRQDRIVINDRGIAAVSATEIRRSDKSQPTGAVLLFARYVRAEELERVSKTSQLPVGITYLRNGQPIAGSPLVPAISKWIHAGGAVNESPLDTSGGDNITSFALLRTPEHQPAALLSVSAPRDIYAIGYRTTWTLLGSIVALVLIFGGVVVLLVLRLHRSYAAHQSVETRYRNIAAQLGESILVTDAISFRIVDANDAVLGALAYSRAELYTRTALDIYPDLDATVLAEAGVNESGRLICTSRMRRNDGTFGECEISITHLIENGRKLLCLVGHDVSHRKAAEEQQKANQRRLLHLAQHDPLTGLPNRLYLRSKLPRVIKHAAASDRHLALVYLDIDHFKNINDSRGHGFGDKLLQIVAQRLRNTVGTHDAVVRMGGDEFVIVASLMPDNQALDALAQRLQMAVSAAISIDGQPLAVTASIGVSVYPRDGLDLEVLLKHADIALYQAKEAGRSCHRFFSADMDLRVSEDVALEQALRHAIGSEQFYMEYQPVVDLMTNRTTSFEALMRWRHPELGVVPPARFVPIAEKSGLIVALGQHAITEALKQLRSWLDAGVPCVPIAVNVAPQQLTRTDFPALVTELTNAAAMDASWLRFEITESALLQNPERMIESLQQLRKLGCQVLIDDIGTGYSALSYLTQLPVDTLKIDRSFITDLSRGTANSQIITAVIDMARRLNLTTVAEGVETKEQALQLRRKGCNFAQGFFYSKPLSPRRCRNLLEKMQVRDREDEDRARQAIAS
jgi:diguanylate cyclase (GGDEF)-like protein/PAS domain S-box-containing protein